MKSWHAVSCVLLAAAAFAASPKSAHAQGHAPVTSSFDGTVDPQHYPVLGERTPQLRWRWPRFDVREYAISGTALAVALGAAAAPVPGWRWSGSTGLDDAVRSAVRLGPFASRRLAGDTSDVLLATTITFPVLFDALVTAWSRRGSGEVARQLLLIDLETLAVSGAVTALTSTLAARERPYASAGQCERELGAEHRDCDEAFRFRYRSFFSGHSSLSFTAAALVCTHHAHLELYGGAGDTAICIAAMTTATATASLRVMADVHYATDVLTGAAVGTLIGFGLPWLLHYKSPPPIELGKSNANIAIVPNPTGLSLVGTF